MTAIDPETDALVSELSGSCPTLFSEVSALTKSWLSDLLWKLNNGADLVEEPKIFTDPVWGSIVLQPQEILLLDTPLLQRLRGVKQLGMAEMVYQGASFGRLEHICGVVESVQRLVVALDASAERLKPPYSAPRITRAEIDAIRLAALLHDIGHGPFSHATEAIVEKNYHGEVSAAKSVLFGHFDDVQKIDPGELLSVLMILSEGVLAAISHIRYPIEDQQHLPLRLISAILGSSRKSPAPYLAGLVSGPIDADKLDYMARDSHHAGLAIGMESTRLLSQLQVAPLTEENAPNELLRSRVRDHGSTIFNLGISRAGVSAYEQMTASRALLYERVYYHHKVRTTEAMVRRLISLAENKRSANLSVSEILTSYNDYTFLLLVGGVIRTGSEDRYAKSAELSSLAYSIVNRDLYHRAFAFAGRYLKGFDGAEDQEEDETRLLVSRAFLKLASDETRRAHIENKIFEFCKLIANSSLGFDVGQDIKEHEIIIDLPAPDRVSVNAKDLLVCSAGGEIEIPNLYFNPESWMKAYRANKMVGYVFAPAKYVPIVNLASKIVFAEELAVSMTPTADRLTKTSELNGMLNQAVTEFSNSGLISKETYLRLAEDHEQFIRIFRDMISVPERIDGVENLKLRIANELNEARPRGYLSSEVSIVSELIDEILRFVEISYKGGDLKRIQPGNEVELQRKLLAHLRSRDQKVTEGEKLGGGEADLVVNDELIIENKILRDPLDNPLEAPINAGWQARRYSHAILREIAFTVVGYVPLTEKGFFGTSHSVKVLPVGASKAVEVRFCVPVGYSVPSRATAPEK